MSRGGQNEDPAWLTESTSAAAVAVGSNKEVQKAVKNAATDHVKEKYLPGGGGGDVEDQNSKQRKSEAMIEFEATIPAEELSSMKKMNTVLRLAMTLVAIAMAIVAVFQILDGPDISS